MDIGMIGLGKMGGNMARRLLQAGHRVVGLDRDGEVTRRLATEAGLTPVFTLAELVAALPAPRAMWVMVPAGAPTEAVIDELSGLLSPGDVIIDGGNTFYKDDLRRSAALAQKGLAYIDVGTSGGVWGLEQGYSLMIGGAPELVERLRPIFTALAPTPETGWGRVGPVGAGHFVKMVHNGIEYGLMQAYAEGFEILQAKPGFDLNLLQVAEIWRHGSVVRSWLLDLTARALRENPGLEGIQGWVADSGEGRWAVFEAIDLDVPAPVITLALQQRFVSRQKESFAARLLAAMRNQFGGHQVRRVDHD
jgi:6-phosphogluconate dehydrogenase